MQGTRNLLDKKSILITGGRFSTEDIPRDRDRNTALKPLSKTRQKHCVKIVQPFVVSYREKSCFCGACLGDGEGGTCAMSDITGDWKVVHLQNGPKAVPTIVDVHICKNIYIIWINIMHTFEDLN